MNVRCSVNLLFAFACFLSQACCIPVHAQDAASAATAPATDWQPPSKIEELPVQTRLPELMRMANGTAVKSLEQWQQRREEIKSMMLFYQYGSMPPRPDKVTAVDIRRSEHKSGKGTVEEMTLLIESSKQPEPLRMRMAMFIPEKTASEGEQAAKRYPVIIREEGTLNGNDFVPTFFDHDYIFIEYARHDLDPDKKDVVGSAQRAYPEYDWATLAVWAWGGMRVVDYLETRDDVDSKHIGITGHSRGGKMALLAGALDERITLVVPNGSGAGGAGSYTMLGPGGESLTMNDKPHWYADRIWMFSGHADRLPFDQHHLKALVAPRALLCIESVDDDYANPVGTQLTSVAAQPAFDLFDGGQPKYRNGITYRNGGHNFSREDWETLLNFAEWHFRGVKPTNASAYQARPYDLPASWYTEKGKQKGKQNGKVIDKPIVKGTESERVARDNQVDPGVGGYAKIENVGNLPASDHFGMGRFGAVAYPYEIGNRQVTNAEYAEFLNAVFTKPNRNVTLYDSDMAIRRTMNGRVSRFSVPSGKADAAVTHVTWYDAVRYCNWLHNGKPTGNIGFNTTEEGAYSVSGKQSVGPRNPDARFALPSDDEWFKAAYYVPINADDGGYRLYRRDAKDDLQVVKYGPAVKSAFGVTGLYDRLWEWNENRVNGLFRSLRSGAWFVGNNRQAAGRLYSNPDLQLANIGFRVVRTDASQQKKSLKNVLILGDSISMGYMNGVRRRLAGEARVLRPQANCGPTTKGLENLDAWLTENANGPDDGKWDVIHFNFGLHDLKYVDSKWALVKRENGKIQVPIEQYERNIAELARRLKKTGAQLIWCSTTPVPDGARGRTADDSVRYNAAALRAVKSVLGEDVAINDLHAFCVPRLEKIQQPANVHFSAAGSDALAEQVVAKLRQQLE